MQLQENPAKVLQGLYGNSTEGLLLKNLYCLEFINPYTSESAVCRRQILTCKDGPRTERIKIFLMAIVLCNNLGIQMKQKEQRHLW